VAWEQHYIFNLNFWLIGTPLFWYIDLLQYIYFAQEQKMCISRMSDICTFSVNNSFICMIRMIYWVYIVYIFCSIGGCMRSVGALPV